MAMPEATVDKNRSPSLDERQIGLARQVRTMESVMQAQRTYNPSDDQFGTGVFGPNLPHNPAPDVRREYVH